MEELTSMTFRSRLIERSDYMTLAWTAYRVVRADNDTTITTRPVHHRAWAEWLHAHWESWVQWPMCDLLPVVRALAAGKRWRLNDGRTIWPLWGIAPRQWRDYALPFHRAKLPWWLGFYGKAQDRYADLYAVLPLVPFFWLWERWAYWRWCFEILGLRYGWYTAEEGGYLSEGRWAGVGEKFPT